MSFRAAALPSSMKAGMLATGTETSCLIEPPSRPCISPNNSRMRQNALACSTLSQIVASSTRPFSSPAARICSIDSRKPSRRCDDSSISTE